jgi:hypothetical protein
MSFFVKGKDMFPRDQVLELLQKQNNLLGKAFSVVRFSDTISKDAKTGENLTGYVVTADVSKEFRDSILSKRKIYLMTQVVFPQFPSNDKPADQVQGRSQPVSQKTRPKANLKPLVKRQVHTLDTMPSVEEFWTKLTAGQRKFFRKWAKTLGSPEMYPMKNPKHPGQTSVGQPSSAAGGVEGARTVPGTSGSSDKCHDLHGSQDSELPEPKKSPPIPTGEEFRRSQLEAKQRANLKKKVAGKKTAYPDKGVQSIHSFLSKK